MMLDDSCHPYIHSTIVLCDTEDTDIDMDVTDSNTDTFSV